MMETLIFTIAYNRNQFLGLSMASVLSHAKNCTYVIWDNARNPETEILVENCALTFKNSSVRVLYESSENIGLNAARAVVDKYRSSETKYIMSMDEDILMLPLGFQNSLQALLQNEAVGYAALDVFQDETTNGAKPAPTSYNPTRIDGFTLLEGPTGGWASMTKTEVYDLVGGYPTRDELFFGLDGLYSEEIRKIGKKTGILQGAYCYHATGDAWNKRFGYDAVLESKLDSYLRWVRSGSP